MRPQLSWAGTLGQRISVEFSPLPVSRFSDSGRPVARTRVKSHELARKRLFRNGCLVIRRHGSETTVCLSERCRLRGKGKHEYPIFSHLPPRAQQHQHQRWPYPNVPKGCEGTQDRILGKHVGESSSGNRTTISRGSVREAILYLRLAWSFPFTRSAMIFCCSLTSSLLLFWTSTGTRWALPLPLAYSVAPWAAQAGGGVWRMAAVILCERMFAMPTKWPLAVGKRGEEMDCTKASKAGNLEGWTGVVRKQTPRREICC